MIDTNPMVDQLKETVRQVESEVSQVIVGQEAVLRGVVTCLLCGGHALLEGVPGLGKTMLVRALGGALDLHHSRIQFTPDLMPGDIIGTNVLVEDEDGQKHLSFRRGPVFSNLVLADEINRATPKTQSALLEAMQERSVSVGNSTFNLPNPFFVLATQNPIEMEGTYPLPEAQLDRFFFKLHVDYPSQDQLVEILKRTTSGLSQEPRKVADGAWLLSAQSLVREVPVAGYVMDYAVRLVLASHPENRTAPGIVRQYLRYGASPRAAQALILAAKVGALLDGRFNVAYADIRHIAKPAMRHRVILNLDAELAGVTADKVIDELIDYIPEEK